MVKITQKYSGSSPRDSISTVGLGRGLEKLFSVNIPGDFMTQQVWKYYHGLFNHFPIKGCLSNLNFLYYKQCFSAHPCTFFLLRLILRNAIDGLCGVCILILDTAILPHNVAVAIPSLSQYYSSCMKRMNYI